jgi:HTH-type transcriptional regulator/antitoxin HigA
MDIKPIETEQDYRNAMSRIDVLWGSKKGTREGDELDSLITIVEAYEKLYWSFD